VVQSDVEVENTVFDVVGEESTDMDEVAVVWITTSLFLIFISAFGQEAVNPLGRILDSVRQTIPSQPEYISLLKLRPVNQA